jgi:hypothetical protein
MSAPLRHYQQILSYITFLVLKDVQIAYAGETEAAHVVMMSRLPELVNGALSVDEERSELKRTSFQCLRISTGNFAP